MATHETRPLWDVAHVQKVVNQAKDAGVRKDQAQFAYPTVQFLLDVIAEKDAVIALKERRLADLRQDYVTLLPKYEVRNDPL